MFKAKDAKIIAVIAQKKDIANKIAKKLGANFSSVTGKMSAKAQKLLSSIQPPEV